MVQFPFFIRKLLLLANIIMSKEYYKKKIIDIRAAIDRERANKKKDNENYAARVKSASTTDMKAYYRKSKISAAASHDRTIESLKRQLDSAKESLKREKN